MAQETVKWYRRNRIVTALIPALIFGLALALMQLDKTPDVRYVGAIERPGYEPAPAYYHVEASANKEWGDYWSKHWYFIAAGFMVSVLGTILYLGYIEVEAKQGDWKPLAAAWVAGALLIFIPFYGMIGTNKYETKLDPATYERVQYDIDDLFPIKK